MYRCPFDGEDSCQKVFETRGQMRQHHAMSHGVSLRLQECEVCGDEFNGGSTRRTCSRNCQSELYTVDEVMSGENNPNYQGAGRSRECRWCGSSFEAYRSQVDAGNAKFCSQTCYDQWRIEEWKPPKGDEHWLWNGGPDIDYGDDWQEVREKVIERDEICQKCDQAGGILDVHHIVPIRTFDEPEEANVMDNLILLCRSCHMKVEWASEEVVI